MTGAYIYFHLALKGKGVGHKVILEVDKTFHILWIKMENILSVIVYDKIKSFENYLEPESDISTLRDDPRVSPCGF